MVFAFNLIIGILFYLILFFSADAISNFFNEPQLKMIIQVVGLSLIISSVSLMQGVRLTKRLDFKQGTKISFTAILYEYLGVDNDYNQFKKIGLMTLRNVRRTL